MIGEATAISKMIGIGKGSGQAIGMGMAGVGVAGVAWKAWEHVPENHVAIRERFKRGRQRKNSIVPWGPRAGEIYKVAEAGPHPSMPGAHRYRMVSVQDRTREAPYDIIAKDATQKIYKLDAKFTWGIAQKRNENFEEIDYGVPYNLLVYRALYRANNELALAHQVESNICVAGLCTLLKGFDLEEVSAKNELQKELSDRLIESKREELLEYGCNLRRVNLSNIVELKLANAHYLVTQDEEAGRVFVPTSVPDGYVA